MATARSVLVVTANILWLLSPPILTVFALRDWQRNRYSAGLRIALPLVLGTVLLADWVFFLHFLIRSTTPYGTYFRPSWASAALLLLSLVAVVTSLWAPIGRWHLAMAGLLILTLWVCVGYAPAHYLQSIDLVTVTVDEHPVGARVYLGHPTDMEAEAFALVRLEHGGGDYLLDFDSERARSARGSEFVRIPGGVWYLKPMQSGSFGELLPPQALNQFRVLSRDGHVVTVQF